MPEEEEVRIVPYDERWPTRFEEERELLQSVLRSWLAGPIEHIGSTAVAGMPAKPVIDIMAGVRDLEDARPAVAVLEAEGYRYAPYRADVMHWLCKPDFSHRTHHLHLVPYDSPLWTERIAFRDCLRGDAGVAAEYAELKAKLAAAHRNDREAYTDAKGAFVERIVRRALGCE